MSDAEIIATFMEPKPENQGRREGIRLLSHGKWWVGAGAPDCHPHESRFDLDGLHEVEAKLTDEQWGDYQDEVFDLGVRAHGQCSGRFRIHLSAEQKIKALAAVLRPVVEGSVQPQGSLPTETATAADRAFPFPKEKDLGNV